MSKHRCVPYLTPKGSFKYTDGSCPDIGLPLTCMASSISAYILKSHDWCVRISMHIFRAPTSLTNFDGFMLDRGLFAPILLIQTWMLNRLFNVHARFTIYDACLSRSVCRRGFDQTSNCPIDSHAKCYLMLYIITSFYFINSKKEHLVPEQIKSD